MAELEAAQQATSRELQVLEHPQHPNLKVEGTKQNTACSDGELARNIAVEAVPSCALRTAPGARTRARGDVRVANLWQEAAGRAEAAEGKLAANLCSACGAASLLGAHPAAEPAAQPAQV